MDHVPWFVLPPVEEYYFKPHHAYYKTLPPFRSDCQDASTAGTNNPMQLIYPKELTKIFVPIDLDGKLSRTVFKVAHRTPTETIHWHLDESYLGSTTDFHEMELNPEQGYHLLTLVDEKGNRLERKFRISVF